MVPSDQKRLDLALKGYRLATAEITYRRPDFRSLLQTHVWQDLDLTPDFPVLKRFLEYWEKHLDTPRRTAAFSPRDQRAVAAARRDPCRPRLLHPQLEHGPRSWIRAGPHSGPATPSTS